MAASSSTVAQVTDKIIILDVVCGCYNLSIIYGKVKRWCYESVNLSHKKKKEKRKKENGLDKELEKVSGDNLIDEMMTQKCINYITTKTIDKITTHHSVSSIWFLLLMVHVLSLSQWFF
jgi:septum formation inhibitor-activating ATPase MinD